MRPSAEPALADGIAQYIELFRAHPAAPDIETMRLLGDLSGAVTAGPAALAPSRNSARLPGRCDAATNTQSSP